MPWIVNVKMTKPYNRRLDIVEPKQTYELLHSDTGSRVYHILRGALARDSMQAYADKLNARNVEPPKEKVKTGCDGFDFSE